MKYSLVAACALSIIGFANSAPVVSQSNVDRAKAHARALPPIDWAKVMGSISPTVPGTERKRSSLQERRSTAVDNPVVSESNVGRAKAHARTLPPNIDFAAAMGSISPTVPGTEGKIYFPQERRSTAVDNKRGLLPVNYTPGNPLLVPPVVPIKQNECSSDADCEGDHYCVTEYSICSEKTREEAMAESAE